MRKRTTAVLAVLVATAACKDGAGPLESTFAATVSGDLQLSLSGTAVFGTATSGTGAQGLIIQLVRGNPTSLDFDLIGFGRFDAARPSVGTYDIHAASCPTCPATDFDAVFALNRTDGTHGQFLSTVGSLTVQESESTRLVGVFSFTAVIYGTPSGLDADTLSIEGSFTAVPGNPVQ